MKKIILILMITAAVFGWSDQMLKLTGYQGDTLWIYHGATIDSALDVNGTLTVSGAVDLGTVTIDTLTASVITGAVTGSADSATYADTSVWAATAADADTATHSLTADTSTYAVHSRASDSTRYADSLTVALISGDVAVDGEWNQTYAPSGGTNVGNIWKTTLQAGETYDGTTSGWAVKLYDEDATVNHDGGENACLYLNLKQLSAMASGGKSMLISGHNYNSAIEIDAGIWLYGKFGYGLKVSGDTVGIGVDFSETAITTADLKLENGATIANATAGRTTVSDTLEATHFDGHLAGLADTASVLVGDWFGSGTWPGNTVEIAVYTAGSTTGAIPIAVFDGYFPSVGIDYTLVADSLYMTISDLDSANATGKTYFYQVRD